MHIVNITDKNKLNDFISRQAHSQFLQSWQWGELQKKIGSKIWRLGVEKDGLIGVATVIKKLLPLGKSYFYCPRGPVLESGVRNLEIASLLFHKTKELAQKEKAIFLRFEPESQIIKKEFKIIETIDIQPARTLILDLSKLEDELLKDMHQKTRYNIKLAGKKGVKVIEAGPDHFKELWQLMVETGQRDRFRLHSKSYYEAMLAIDKNFIRLFLAEYQGEIIAANIISFFGDTATYMHGASASKFRNAMAPYALQWHGIKLAQKQEYKYYDFFGINEEQWPGVTRFKKGFSGEEKFSPGTFDLVFNQGWYNVYKAIRKTRRVF